MKTRAATRVGEQPLRHADVHKGRSVWHVWRGGLCWGTGPSWCRHFIHCDSAWWRYETFPAGPPLDKSSGLPVDQPSGPSFDGGWMLPL